jgi:uncharacterized tellurite resistance protein B-like protein
MVEPEHFHLGLLYMVHLLIGSDGKTSQAETDALLRIKQNEGIPDQLFRRFANSITTKSERETYLEGIDYLNKCTDPQKLRVFVHLYKLAEVDGNVHVKEVRLLLYSIKATGIEFNDVVEMAKREN